MAAVPERVAAFLRGPRIAVAGVSRDPRQPANAIFRKLRAAGLDVVAVNPRAAEVEDGVRCWPDLAAVPGTVDALMVVTPPATVLDLVRAADARGIRRIWLHRSFGDGSVADDAVRECARRGLDCLVGGCPMMYVAPDPFHRCTRWWLGLRGRVPA